MGGTSKKIDIATEYLDVAIQLYFEGKYFSAIHLAGAAAELLGAHLPEPDRHFTLAWKAQKALAGDVTGKLPTDTQAKKVINNTKNAIKHMDDNSDSEIDINSSQEAIHGIEHALSEYYKLKLPKSENIWRFEDSTVHGLEQK